MITRTPGPAHDLIACSTCGDFMQATGTEEQRAEDAAWFTARHRARHEHEQPPRAARSK